MCTPPRPAAPAEAPLIEYVDTRADLLLSRFVLACSVALTALVVAFDVAFLARLSEAQAVSVAKALDGDPGEVTGEGSAAPEAAPPDGADAYVYPYELDDAPDKPRVPPEFVPDGCSQM